MRGGGGGRVTRGGLDDVVRNGDWRERDRIVIMDRKYCRCEAEESDNINESKTKASDKELGVNPTSGMHFHLFHLV